MHCGKSHLLLSEREWRILACSWCNEVPESGTLVTPEQVSTCAQGRISHKANKARPRGGTVCRGGTARQRRQGIFSAVRAMRWRREITSSLIVRTAVPTSTLTYRLRDTEERQLRHLSVPALTIISHSSLMCLCFTVNLQLVSPRGRGEADSIVPGCKYSAMLGGA